MKLSEYAQYDAIGLGQLVARGEVSPQELAETALRACAAVNPHINAVIETWQPELADAAAALERGSPLAGVPFLIKDVGVAMAGRKIEFGSRLAQGFTAAADSILMRRFRQAGLATLGRTTTPEFAWSGTTESALSGPTRNPWNAARGAGGSSGGAAAAVAAGIVPIAHATDAAGSIRIPAAASGVFGLKPTRGRVSNGPILDEAIHGLAAQLGVSRSVRDSAALLDAARGADGGQPFSIAEPAGSYFAQVGAEPGRLRIGVMAQAWGGQRTAAAVLERLAEATRLCESLGHIVEEAALPLGCSWDAFVHASSVLWAANIAVWIDDMAAATGRQIDLSTLEQQTLAVYRTGHGMRGVEIVRALDLRNAVTRSVAAFFTRYDLLLTPTLPELAPPIGSYAADTASMDGHQWTAHVMGGSPFTPAFNAAGVPAMSAPLFQDAASALPVGMQFVAPAGREDRLFRLAGQLERSLPWADRKPAIWAGRDPRAEPACRHDDNRI
ncbi:amidase [Chromobacterium subtsugae]|uniref:amidase n=1 Tax=Chromobacterium subtsugae TaxID=251747 RepID=UPI0007F87976|nr:amidase family protein [Chromobacterium subtsugae]